MLVVVFLNEEQKAREAREPISKVLRQPASAQEGCCEMVLMDMTSEVFFFQSTSPFLLFPYFPYTDL
jgi:hypothetical protein